MGRKERHDVDYFPFFIKEGRTLFILEGKYQCKGTGFFTNLFRFLSRTPDHHFQLKSESDRLYFFASTRCDEESAVDMIEIMVTTGKLDRELWTQEKVIASQDYLDSVHEAYRKRENRCISMDAIKEIYKITSGSNTQGEGKPAEEIHQEGVSDGITSSDNPQRKLKERKLKERKEGDGETVGIVLPSWIPKEPWEGFVEMRKEIKKPLTGRAIRLAINKLQDLKSQGHDPGKVLDESTLGKWQGLFPLKDGSTSKGNRHAGIKAWLERDNEEARQDEICQGDGSPVRDI